MSAIWHNDEAGWRLLAPAGFVSEAVLHDLVEQAPQIMPLAGSPNLVVVGREVSLGGNKADLIAVEPSGRLVVIEVKLAKNAEARRAVIAQVLTYAAYLRGLDLATLERDILGPHLAERRFSTLAEAVAAADQTASFDGQIFEERLTDGLEQGRFRLVLVLDEAPPELVRLVGYLEAVADKLVIDLVTVAAYEVAGAKVVVPQRIDPERPAPQQPGAAPKVVAVSGGSTRGSIVFEEATAASPVGDQPLLRQLTEWAKTLERDGLAALTTNQGPTGHLTLLPRLRAEGVGLVTISNNHGPYLSFWRSAIERYAPSSLARIEQAAAPAKVGQGTTIKEPSDDLLDALTDAYREAARGEVHFPIIERSEAG